MTRYKLFLVSTVCEGVFMPVLPVFDIEWGKLRG